jgi:hypothetical protein
MNRLAALLFAVIVLIIIAPRLPAPIVEEPTPQPTAAAKAKAESKSSVAKPARIESGMSSRSVQVVLTENTRAAILYLRKRVQEYESQPLAGKSDVHPDEILQQLRQALGTRFNNVSILDGGSPSRGEGLTMIFDLQAKVGTISFTTNTVSFTATFKNGAGRTLQTISSSGKSMVPYPGFFGTQFSKATSKAFADFSQKLNATR